MVPFRAGSLKTWVLICTVSAWDGQFETETDSTPTEDIMIVSWNWLKDYVSLNVELEEVVSRLTMSGLNLESVEPVGDDFAIDLEVTSNRPDCLGHLGVAREAGMLFNQPLRHR